MYIENCPQFEVKCPIFAPLKHKTHDITTNGRWKRKQIWEVKTV